MNTLHAALKIFQKRTLKSSFSKMFFPLQQNTFLMYFELIFLIIEILDLN